LITLPQLETLLTEKSRNEQLILKTNEALMAYASELKRIKKVLFAAAGQSDQQADDNSSEGKQKATESGNNQSMDAIIKRLVKCKDDNKKLKSILK
jgi:hypothetical protein